MGERFGYPATHLVLADENVDPKCDSERMIFGTSMGDRVDGGMDIREYWVVDVAGTTLVVESASFGDVPAHISDQLSGVVNSIEFVVKD